MIALIDPPINATQNLIMTSVRKVLSSSEKRDSLNVDTTLSNPQCSPLDLLRVSPYLQSSKKESHGWLIRPSNTGVRLIHIFCAMNLANLFDRCETITVTVSLREPNPQTR